MSDEFEDLVKRWMRDRAATDRSTLAALAGNVATLPPRRRSQPSQLAAAAAVIVALGLAAIALAPRINYGTGVDTGPVPPNPAAFAGDPRLARCGASVDTAIDAFEMGHARLYRLYMPAMLLSPELDVDEPAFVVVYAAIQPFGVAGAPQADGRTQEPRSLTPRHHDVCVLVGTDPATAEMNIYSDVDTTGLTLDVNTSASFSPEGTPPTTVAPPSATPEPAPSWVADLAGQLVCEGRVAGLGGEYPSLGSPETYGDTPDAAISEFLGPSNPYASLPATGFEPLYAESHWASYRYAVDGHAKAIILLSDTTDFGPGWAVVALRACDASEFDPATPLTFPVTVWSDASGNRASTETISSIPGPGHCGWESSTWLRVDGELYFRDPKKVMAEWTVTRFDARATLPKSAGDTGYRSGKWSLWLVPGGDAFLVSPGIIERWPRSTDPLIGCA
jgi:hypothetical protein